MSIEIRPVEYSELLFRDILDEVAAKGGAFMFRLRDHWIDGSERFDRRGEILLGAFVGGKLVGTAGISNDPYEPEDGLGRVRHVYVLIEYRKRGIARTLLQQLMEHAPRHFRVLRLHSSNPAAVRLYESLGFTASTHGRETHRLRLQTSSTRRP